MMPDEYEKVYRVHSFEAKPGAKKRQAWEAIHKAAGAKWYILKYASKYEQKEVPANFGDVGRFWGCSSDVQDRDPQIVDVTEEEVRVYLANKTLSVTKAEILPKRIIIPK